MGNGCGCRVRLASWSWELPKILLLVEKHTAKQFATRRTTERLHDKTQEEGYIFYGAAISFHDDSIVQWHFPNAVPFIPALRSPFFHMRFLMFSLYSSFADEVPIQRRKEKKDRSRTREGAENILCESIACCLCKFTRKPSTGPAAPKRRPVPPSARKWFLHSATNCLNDEPVASVGRRTNGFSRIESQARSLARNTARLENEHLDR